MSLGSGGRTPLAGALLGTAVGDAVGLRFENLPARRVERRLRDGLVPRFVGGRCPPSDDTAHAFATVQALLESTDPDGFADALSRRLRWWLLTLPAGIGFATLRALTKSWLGFAPSRSGVASAGNGPLMRAPVIGAAVTDPEHALALTDASTRITHTDPRAVEAARAVTAAAGAAARGEGVDGACAAALRHLAHPELLAAFEARRTPPVDPTGFVVPTLRAVFHALEAGRGEPGAVIEAAIRLGGDTDTIAAVAGGIAGAGRPDDLPPAWLASLWWCHDAAELELAADRFTGRATPRAPLPERRLVEATLHQVVFWRSMAELAWRLVER